MPIGILAGATEGIVPPRRGEEGVCHRESAGCFSSVGDGGRGVVIRR